MSAAEDPSDQSLTARAAKGDQAAFAILMNRHKGWLFRFTRRYVGEAEDAYDVVQESFASAWLALARYDPARPFDIWLRRIALNKCRDRARKAAVRRVLFGHLGPAEHRPEVVDDAPPPEQAAASQRALARLEAAIASLPRGLKEPLVLSALEGMSHKEVGAILGLNAKAVETRVYRARKQLALILERSDLDDISG